jgi:predicted ATP-dependent endonuclease of OLD family
MTQNPYIIKSITINNYRSFSDSKRFTGLKPINILIGPNSSGKSNFANALRLLLKPDTGTDHGGGHGRSDIKTKNDFYNENKIITLQCEFAGKNELPVVKQCQYDNETVKLIKVTKLTKCRKRFFPIGPDRSWHKWANNSKYLYILEFDDDLRKKVQNKMNNILKLTGQAKIELPSKTSDLIDKSLADYLKGKDKDGIPTSEIGSGIGMFLYFIAEIENTIANTREKDENGIEISGTYIFLIEEPENHMHPSLQKMFLSYLIKLSKTGKQFFITTHSPFIINFASSSRYKKDIGILNFKKEYSKGDGKYYTTYEDISCNNSKQIEMLERIGVKASDLLQPNGIIWVEGPSDRIYINQWLKLWTKKYRKKKYEEGTEYIILPYNGSLKNYEFFNDNNNHKNRVKVINLNHNYFVVIDRDRGKKDKGKWKSKIDFINEVKKSNVWLTSETAKVNVKYKGYNRKIPISTIEGYLPESIKKKFKNRDKIEFAYDNIDKLKLNISDLNEKIKTIYNKIKEWNK